MKNILLKNSALNKTNNKGFTLVELMVVIGIIAIISALSLFNSSKLNSSVLLSNTAYEVGLIIRDAQVAGLGAKVLSVGGSPTLATTSNQGVFFDITKPQQIVVFADLNNNNKYDPPVENSQIYNIENKRAGKVLNVCKLGTANVCISANLIGNVNVIFKRPNPEAYFYTVNSSLNLEEILGNIVINMGFVGGECRSITIYKTGAIQIDKNFCP